ncbi:MAG: Glutathione synthase/Ribosomal protein S6 modification enzyme (glutaminyl transferase) [Idiomarinaceae bacterium HL-53]|nr:MAG: Glutathione synthase/Ribosomal protein S6 modification enzyme (glutaminyl transferase) [Idiomarinaceae bacterium HL-53]CUS48108.1 ATP-grasp domain-containing protein [Idiomarinaceae bacterium HL-53]
MKEIVVIHENPEWLVPLYEAFKERGYTFREWFVNEGVIAYDQPPADAVYYNRMSASSHTRGHRYAPEFARMALTWLEQNPVTVVNGTHALYLEVCKISQYAALTAAGVKVPRTRAVNGRDELTHAAEDFQQWPLILKPNRGGKGLGVMRFDDLPSLQNFIESDDYETPLDGIWLLQEYIKPKNNRITRCEFVGREFIYAVNVDTSDGFELCPADVCAIDDAFYPTGVNAEKPAKFQLTQHLDGHLLITKLRDFLHAARVDVAGIEVIENEAGELFVYDVNTNTNYNQEAERAAQAEVTGMGALADYLIGLAQQ